MATLVLQVAGTALGTVLGGPLGAALGSAIGATAGNYLDRTLLAGPAKHSEGPRLKSLAGITANEGAPIPRLYGRARLGGQVIWATEFEEVVTRQKVRSGGKGSPATPTQTTYSYFGNVAIALCEGPIAFVRRVWADGEILDLTKVTMRVYRGGESQEPDPLIIAREGRSDIPAYRGIAYVVFEHLPLADYGNRLPVLSFETVRPVDGIGRLIRAIELIPGATEFGYDTAAVTELAGYGVSRSENRNQLHHANDFQASLDALQALCPNLRSVALVIAWFGDDLRAGQCTIRPKVDLAAKSTSGSEWAVNGVLRSSALEVSRVGDRAAYGGTPSDASVLRATAELKARGLEVMIYPFLMMDVPAGNALPDPHTGSASQPPYPWRGRITCSPARGAAGSVDGTATADAQVGAFFGLASAGNFSNSLSLVPIIAENLGDGLPVYQVAGSTTDYAGPAEWSFRRFILHHAALARAAGGVTAFLIGSEMVGLTHVRGAGSFPAVSHLVALASEVRAMLGSATAIGYAADWTEYGCYVPSYSEDVWFPLDPLWALPAIDFVGIDFYAPLTDWRDGDDHLDAALTHSIYQPAYLASRFRAGEDHDWYYLTDADRDAQIRTPIADGTYGKPWTFRAKDITSWWANAHVERLGGVEVGHPTGWIPRSKPIWITEYGIPAVDKGTNSPNLFPDPKSSESAAPPYSSRGRDDLLQARAIEAIYQVFDPRHPRYVAGSNPVSPIYGGWMVDPDRIYLWTWDARPFPAFPHRLDVWGDGDNWTTGHWLTGRLEGVPLDRLIAAIMSDFELGEAAFEDVDGFVDGYVIDRPMAARAAIEPLARLYGVEAIATAGTLRFAGKLGGATAVLDGDDLIADRNGILLRHTRTQERELPHEVSIGFIESALDFRPISASSRRLSGASRREARLEIAALMPREEGQRLADRILQDAWTGRDTIEFSIRPSRLALEVGDILSMNLPNTPELLRVSTITDGLVRKVAARAVDPSIRVGAAKPALLVALPQAHVPGPPFAMVLDLAAADGSPTGLQYIAATARPWPGSLTVWQAGDGGGYTPLRRISQPATLGRTTTVMPAGPLWRWDRMTSLTVEIFGQSLASLDDAAVFGGANTLAVRGADGAWEILSFARAELIGTGTYRLGRLLRGLRGSELQALRSAPAGSPVVMLDEAVLPLVSGNENLGHVWTYRIAPSASDYTDVSAVSLTANVSAVALLPLAPVHLEARRSASGVALSWIRRTRTGGDSWGLAEVPLGENAESYQLDILSGNTVRRTLRTSSPGYLYPASDELVDFGSVQSAIRARVRQISTEVGAGTALDTSVWIN